MAFLSCAPRRPSPPHANDAIRGLRSPPPGGTVVAEAVAFRLLRRTAMDRRMPIAVLAERLIAGEDSATLLAR